MRRLTLRAALAIAIAAAPAKAQEQKTLGPCSPAVAGVNGNVAVTCVTGEHRIRVAKFSTDDLLIKNNDLAEFIESNSGQIIYLDVWLGFVMSIFFYDETKRRLDLPFDCSKHLCWLFGVSSIDVYFTETNNVENTIKYRDYWRFRGYYLIESDGCTGVSPKKTCEYRLRAIDDKIIALSDKYDTR